MKHLPTALAISVIASASLIPLAHSQFDCRNALCNLSVPPVCQLSELNYLQSPLNPINHTHSETKISEQTPAGLQVDEHFNKPWAGNLSPDGLFKINGPWNGTGGNFMSPQNVVMPARYGKDGGGFLQLKVPGQQSAPPYKAAEIQSVAGSNITGNPGYGYGYYETRLQVSATPGVCDSFFWIQSPSYGPQEIDFEFLTNEDWIHQPDLGKVHVTIDIVPGKDEHTAIINLPFNPSRSMHRYGFLYTPGKVQFTVDGHVLSTLSDPRMTAPKRGGFIMANEWTGNPNWGGGPPVKTATSTYSWIKFASGFQKVPSW